MHQLLAVLRRTMIFAGFGAALAALFLAVGALRALVVLFMGGHLARLDPADVRTLVFYVGGFVTAGALFGLFHPLLRGRVGTTLGCILGGVIVVFAIAIGDGKGIHGIDWIAYPAMGIVFGGAAAYGVLKES